MSTATISATRPTACLLPQHLADLRKSGLSDETIAACGFRSLRTAEAVSKALNWGGSYRGGLGDCLMIPFFDAAGNRIKGYVRLKPDRPRQKDGKPVKYESPRGAANRAYTPPGTRKVLKNASVPIILTEGEKKSAMADQEGFPCVGLVGVYGFQDRREKDEYGQPVGERKLIPDLQEVAWKGRLVYIIYDSDAATKPAVRKAEYHLAETLKNLGAVVKIVRLPAAGDEKVGLDDFLVAHGREALQKLMEQAEEPAEPATPNEAADDPSRLARIFLADTGDTIRFYRDDHYRHDGVCYQPVAPAELSSLMVESVKKEFARLNLLEIGKWKQEGGDEDKKPTVRKVTKPLIGNVLLHVGAKTIIPAATEMPAWIGTRRLFPPDEILAAKNGLVHLPSLVAGKEFFLEPTPDFFTCNAIDYEFSKNAARPAVWLGFLEQLWANDPSAIELLQEWFGYSLMPDTRHQKILLMVGPKRGGKGTIARIMRKLIGEANVATPTLSSLQGEFGLQPLLGKTAAIISDARLSGRADAAVIAERLLSISGEDAQDINRKFLPSISARLRTRFTILTNELPRLNDASGALPSRFLILRMTESWYGREDHGLEARLLPELPGILLWAIEGWRRLRDRGRFHQPDSGQEMIQELEDLASPVAAFVREKCRVAAGGMVECGTLYSAYRGWCEEQGREHPPTQQVFGRDLRSVLPAVRTTRPRDGGQRPRAYEGISLI